MDNPPIDQALTRLNGLLAATINNLESLVELRAILTGGYPIRQSPAATHPEYVGVLAVELVRTIRGWRDRDANIQHAEVQKAYAYTHPSVFWSDLAADLQDPEFRRVFEEEAEAIAATDADAIASLALAARVAPLAARQEGMNLAHWLAITVLADALHLPRLLDGDTDLDERDRETLTSLWAWHQSHSGR